MNWKWWLWIIVGVIALVIVLFSLGLLFFTKGKPETLLKYLEEKSEENTTSLLVIRNDETLISINENTMLPLASMVKVVIAMEYALQCESGEIDPERIVPLTDIDNYYLPRTDGGAHEAWLAYLKENEHIHDNGTSLEYVAKGMILFSSNANTEYLLHLLDNEKVNQRLIELEIEHHEPLYPFSSAILIPTYLKKENSALTKKQLQEKLRKMSQQEYIELAEVIFTDLKNGKKAEYMDQIITNTELQKIWSDRLPRSTAREYAELMEKLNGKTFFSPEAQVRLDVVMEGLMENPHNQEWLQHAGQKGGSTMFVLTNAAYATDNEGNRTIIVLMLNELGLLKQLRFQNGLNEFTLKTLTEEAFRERMKELGI